MAAAIEKLTAAVREIELQAQLLSLAVEVFQALLHRRLPLGSRFLAERLELRLRHVFAPRSAFFGAFLFLALLLLESCLLQRVKFRRMAQEIELHVVVQGHREHGAVQGQLLNRRRLQISREDIVGTRTKTAARHKKDRIALRILPVEIFKAHLPEDVRMQLLYRHRAAQHRLLGHRMVEDQRGAAAQHEKVGKNENRGEKHRRDQTSNYLFPACCKAQHQARTFCRYALISSPSSIFMTSARISLACTAETARSFSLTRGIDGALILSSVSPIAIKRTAA